MKVTYLESPTSLYKLHTFVTGILTENLIRNDKIDVTFNYSILKNNTTFKILHEKVKNSAEDSVIANYCKHHFFAMRNFSVLAAFQKNQLENYVKTIETEIVLVTCWTSFSLPFIKILLEHGKRVVAGGTIFNIFSFDYIRQLLTEMGTDPKLLENLIIVKGYVDLTTDIRQIIINWKDHEIIQNDFRTIWIGRRDYIKQVYAVYQHFEISKIWYTVLFSNDCWYKKCTFCNLENQCIHNFIKDADPNTVFEFLLENLRDFESPTLYIDNPYFVFSREKEQIIKRLRERGYKITVSTGIHLLQKEEYINKLNNFVDKVFVGLECASDFALAYINKGYNYDQISAAVNKITKHLKKDVQIKLYCIHDLVMKDRTDVITNYSRLAQIKQQLLDSHFKEVQFYPSSLYLFNSPDLKYQNQSKHLKITNRHDFYNSGVWRIYSFLEQKVPDIYVDPILKHIIKPYQRLDIHGNLLPSDFDIVPTDIFTKAIHW